MDALLSIDLLAENKKVIPIYFKNGEHWHTDIKMPDLVIHNKSGSDSFVLKEILLVGSTKGKQVVTFRQGEREIKPVIAEANQLLNKLVRRPVNAWRSYNLHMLFGDVPLTQDTYGESQRLEPDSATCIRLQDLFRFHFAGSDKIDALLCQIRLSSGTQESTSEFSIPLTIYQCKGNYHFPIKGSVTITGTPWNRVMGHRLAVSQEFAVDVVDFRRDENGTFALSSPPQSNKVGDYFLFERPIHAIGDGTVVAAGDQWPNAWVENPLLYSEQRIVELTQKLLADGIEFNHAILGNYAVIDHQNGEFSLYAHMSQGTLTVKVGDRVKRGQVIGRVGNTSNSDFPHLHFHLMDSPDFQTANGLPVTFKDLPAGRAPMFDFKESNSLLYSDYIFAHIPE